MALGQEYCRQLRRHLTGLHANFPPNRPIALADYGVKRNDVFQRLGNIAQLGIQFVVKDGTPTSSVQFKSEGAVDVEFIAKGDLTLGGSPAVRAGLELRFGRKDAVFFNVAGCTISQIDDVAAVGESLIQLQNGGRWDGNFLVVTSLVKAAHTTAIASADRGSEVKLEASADAVKEIDLADASLSLRTKRSRSTALEIVTANEQTPLMQLFRVRGLFKDAFEPEAIAPMASDAAAFSFTADDDLPVVAEMAASDEALAQVSMDSPPSIEFNIEPRPSNFELVRAIAAYIPLLEVSYALANGRPVAFPNGYEPISEIRADLEEMVGMTESTPSPLLEAVQNDLKAMQAGVIDPSAFGFVVRESSTGAILICIRGTQTPREWLANFTTVPNVFSEAPEFGFVHLGFERMHRSVRTSIRKGLTDVPTSTRVTVLGHSLGGAMSTLAAVDLRRNCGRSRVDICTFGAPRVGKVDFRLKVNREIPECFRVTNQFDIVPHVPSLITGWNHAGEEIEVNGDVDSPHSLQAYLQGLRDIGQSREIVTTSAHGSPGLEALLGHRLVSIRVP